jgi:hypothetical protein
MDKFIKFKTHQLIKNNICPYCNKKFDTLIGVMTHISMVYPCKEKNIENILKNSKKSEFVVCQICGKYFKRLFHHVKKYHNLNSKEYKEKYGKLLSDVDREGNLKTLKISRDELWKTKEFRDIHSSDEIKLKISNSLKNYFKNNVEARDNLSKKASERNSKISLNKRFKSGYYLSVKSNRNFFYQSGFELSIMKELDSNKNIINWEKNSNTFLEYYSPFTKMKKRYIFDFFVYLNNNIFLILETKQYPDENILFKLYALDKFCVEKNYKWALINHMKDLNIAIFMALENKCRRCNDWI